MEAGHDNGRDPACRNLIEDPRPTADVLAGTVPAHDPPVPYFRDTGDGRDTVTHGIRESDTLDLLKRAETGKVSDGELRCRLPRDPELAGISGEPDRGCAMVYP